MTLKSPTHPSIGMLKRLVVLNMRGCERVRSFPSKVKLDSLQVLNIRGCLNINQLPDAFGSRWRTSIPCFVWNQHPQRSVSLAGLHMLRSLNLSKCNLVQVFESIEGLSCLEYLILKGNNFTSLPGSLSQVSHLERLDLNGCKKLGVLPELPHSICYIYASDCTSLSELLSLASLHKLKSLNLSYYNILEVSESIGGLSYLKELDLSGNNFSSLPGNLSQLSHLETLDLDYCEKLEVIPVLPPSLRYINAADCTSLREVAESSDCIALWFTKSTRTAQTTSETTTSPKIKVSLSAIAIFSVLWEFIF